MIFEQDYPSNMVAYLGLKPLIDSTYPPGHHLAIARGEIIGSAPTAEELDSVLTASGPNPEDVLIVRAGEDFPEITWIL